MTKVKIVKDTVYQYFLFTVWQDSMWHVHVEKHNEDHDGIGMTS